LDIKSILFDPDMADNRCKGNLLRQCYATSPFVAHIFVALRAIRPAFLGLLRTILDLSMHYYVFRNEQQFLQPLGSGS
jgi:hypothetical protein